MVKSGSGRKRPKAYLLKPKTSQSLHIIINGMA